MDDELEGVGKEQAKLVQNRGDTSQPQSHRATDPVGPVWTPERDKRVFINVELFRLYISRVARHLARIFCL
jgi:hypothetical protein